MRIAVVEDDPKICSQTAGFATDWLDSRHLVGAVQCFSSAEAFLEVWSPYQFSLVLLDCILSREKNATTGMDLARRMRDAEDRSPVVFTTTSRDFAVEGYSVQAVGYLVKPFSAEELASVLDKITLPAPLARIADVELDIPICDMLWCHADGHYVELHSKQEKRRIRGSFRNVQETLCMHGNFVTTARGCLANLDMVAEIDGYNLVLINGDRVPISRDRLPGVRKAWLDHVFNQARNS